MITLPVINQTSSNSQSTGQSFESAQLHNETSDAVLSTGDQKVAANLPVKVDTKSVQDGIIEDRVTRIMNMLKTASYTSPGASSSSGTTQMSQATASSTSAGLVSSQPLSSFSPSTTDPHTKFTTERTKIIRQECELQERTRLIGALKSEVSRLKDEHDKERKTLQDEMDSKLSLQRKHYEALIKRTQSVMDKTLADKEDLFRRCEVVTDEFKQVEKQFKSKIQSMEENHMKELKRRKELWETAERMKRERWIQDKSKLIKEQTMKGFEPEIQKLVSQHKTQMQRLEEKLKSEWSKERQAILDEHQGQLDCYREKIATERRRAADEEREIARQRYQRQLERDEIELQQQRRKMAAQFDEEKDRLQAAWKEEKKAEIESWRVKCDELGRQINDLRSGNAAEAERLIRNHDLEMSRLRDILNRENEEWKQQMMKQTQREQEKKDKELIAKLIKERDEEIEKVIKKLEEETYSNSNNMSSEHRSEIQRIQNEHKDELRMLQNQLNSALEKVISIEEDFHTRDQDAKKTKKDILKIRNEVQTKDKLIHEQKTELQRLRAQRADMRATVEKEVHNDMEVTQIKLRALEKTLSEKNDEIEGILKNHKQEKVKLVKDKASELEKLEEDVKDTLAKKDWDHRRLMDEIELVKAQNAQLQDMLEEQRKQLVQSLS